MTDYRELLGISDLSLTASEGDRVKVAVLDTGIPAIEDILVYSSANFTNESTRDSGHATFIGSMLFGRGKIHGICAKATACFIKVFNGVSAKPEVVAQAIDHAVNIWHVDIINLSLGFSRENECPDSIRKACQNAIGKGVTIVAAAGNNGGRVMWPAALPEVISVGSVDKDGKAEFSNHGEIDFVVPGKDLEGQDSSGNTIYKSGTSFSTAIITGMLTLLLARRRKNNKTTSPFELKQELISNCKDLGIKGWDEDTGYGYPFAPMINNLDTNCGIVLIINSVFDKIRLLVDKVILALTWRNN